MPLSACRPRDLPGRAYVERVIGSIRRERLFHEAGLRRTLSWYFSCYHGTRPHFSLEKDSPDPRSVQPPELGRVVAISESGDYNGPQFLDHAIS